MRTWHFLSIGLLGIGCSGGEAANDPSASGVTDITDQDGGQNGGTAAPTVPPTCMPQPGPDLPDDAFEDSNCDGIDGDRAAAIFVSPSGSDDSPGTLEAPVRTLSKATTLAAATRKYVLVANGVYPESLVLDESTAPPAIYGGYKDKTWQRVEDRAVVAPSSGVPLTIRGSGIPLLIDRMSFKAPVALEPSASSVAVFAVNSQPVTFTHATLEASRGAAGESPPPPTTDTSPGPQLYGARGLDGESSSVYYDACGMNAYIPAECYQPHLGGGAGTWQDGVGWGGPGGTGGYIRSTGGYVSPTNGSKGGLAGGGTGGMVTDGLHGAGLPGAQGSPGTGGRPGTALGVVTESGYTASNSGTSGSSGADGGGGGGGAGRQTTTCWSGEIPTGYWLIGTGGGQGGHGGRGGQGAPGSPAGGASIGLLIFNTNVSLVSSTITTSSGGRGGDATPGADGQEGGAGGWGGSGFQSCYGSATWYYGYDGGPGGRGGMGGAGGAGGGGPSIGILSGSPAPKTQNVTINLGAGGKGGFGINAPNASDGLSKEIHQIGGVNP